MRRKTDCANSKPTSKPTSAFHVVCGPPPSPRAASKMSSRARDSTKSRRSSEEEQQNSARLGGGIGSSAAGRVARGAKSPDPRGSFGEGRKSLRFERTNMRARIDSSSSLAPRSQQSRPWGERLRSHAASLGRMRRKNSAVLDSSGERYDMRVQNVSMGSIFPLASPRRSHAGPPMRKSANCLDAWEIQRIQKDVRILRGVAACFQTRLRRGS